MNTDTTGLRKRPRLLAVSAVVITLLVLAIAAQRLSLHTDDGPGKLAYEPAVCRDANGKTIPGAQAIYADERHAGYRFTHNGRVLDVRPGEDLRQGDSIIGHTLSVNDKWVAHYVPGHTPTGNEPFGDPDAGGIIEIYKTCIETAVMQVRQMSEARQRQAIADTRIVDDDGANGARQ